MSAPEARERRLTLLLALLLVLAVLALYWPVRGHGFVSYDDEVYLTLNPRIAKGLDWAEIRWLLTHEHAANYHPLTWLSHMLDVELFGLDPGPHHVVNVVLHALNAVLVLLLARALLASAWAGALAAALFALHPLRVESVAWASERKDVLCALFFLAALLAHLRHGRAPSAARYALVLVLLALALLAKPMAVTFPCVAVLLDVWPLGRLGERGRRARVWLEKLPLVALAAGGALSTWFAQEVAGAVSTMRHVPLDLRLWNALATYGVYLRETVWPAKLAVFHPLAVLVHDDARAELAVPAALAALVLAIVSALAWRARRSLPWFLLGWCWYLGTLVPVIGLKQVGVQAHADRYTYLPLVGVAWIAAGLVLELARRRPRLRAPAAAAALVALLALAVRARAQLAVWRDTPSLFEHALAVTERNYVAHAALGSYHLEQGDPERARGHLEQALAINPLDSNALTTLARLELDRGELDAAAEHLALARRIHASKWTRYQLARLALARGDPQGAAREFAAALELDPSMVTAHVNLGQVLYGLGRRDEARVCFEQALALDPLYAGAHNGLGVLALEAGDLSTAEQRFARALELDPDYADACHNLAVALERQGRTSEARARYQEARRLAEAQRSP